MPQDDVTRAVDAGVAMGLLDISTGSVRQAAGDGSGAVSVPAAFNRALLGTESLAGRPLALASGMTGTGHSVGDLDAAILHELVERGREGLAGRVDARLATSGRALQRDGQAITAAAERLKLVEAACEAFCTNSLPQLERLGVVDRA